jgi:hypothetical protein
MAGNPTTDHRLRIREGLRMYEMEALFALHVFLAEHPKHLRAPTEEAACGRRSFAFR